MRSESHARGTHQHPQAFQSREIAIVGNQGNGADLQGGGRLKHVGQS